MKTPRNDLPSEVVRELFDYDPAAGELTYRFLPSNSCRRSGKPGTVSAGSLAVTVRGVRYLAHRVIFLWMTGRWPEGVIDHIDGNRLNNKWENLRDVSQTTNVYNTHVVPSHKKHSKLYGAHWCKQLQLWKSSITVAGKVHHLGVFETDVDASNAYIKAKTEMHPGFSLKNFKGAVCAQ